MIDLSPLEKSSRLLVEAQLSPVQGTRFQPTGFPDLGAATFRRGESRLVLVESAQSMANRTESGCWDEACQDLVPPLQGLPYVHVDVIDGGKRVASTSSIQEAHRLNSPYVLEGRTANGGSFKDVFIERSGYNETWPVELGRVAAAVFAFDPCSLLHGLFMSNLAGGRLRIARALSSFIEAKGIEIAQSGGVKNDRVNPSGDAEKGFGNVPFARTEYTAESIVAYFNLDLRQIRSYGLDNDAERLLVLLAMFKIRRVLDDGLRLRTACDLRVDGVTCGNQGFTLPEGGLLGEAVSKAIVASSSAFAQPAVTRLRFESTEKSKQASKKSRKEKAAEASEEGEPSS